MTINKNILTLNKADNSGVNSSSRLRVLPLYLPLVLVILLIVWGSSMAYKTLNQKPPQISGINQPVETSYGSIIVSEADDLIGLTSQDLAGVTHGIQNLVLVDKTQIQLTVALLNRSGQRISISPKDFTLVNSENAMKVILISNATIHDGELQPRSNIEATLSFVVPRDGASYILQYQDPGNDKIVEIDLGGVDVVSDEELSRLHH